jgi:hypothetical protein
VAAEESQQQGRAQGGRLPDCSSTKTPKTEIKKTHTTAFIYTQI